MECFEKHSILDAWESSEYSSGLIEVPCSGTKKDKQEGWYIQKWL